MTTKHNPEAKLVRSQTRGGFNMRSGAYNRFRCSEMKCGIEYTDDTGFRFTQHYRRKKDAVAVFEFIEATDWDGGGDLESQFLRWAVTNNPEIFDTWKGEI